MTFDDVSISFVLQSFSNDKNIKTKNNKLLLLKLFEYILIQASYDENINIKIKKIARWNIRHGCKINKNAWKYIQDILVFYNIKYNSDENKNKFLSELFILKLSIFYKFETLIDAELWKTLKSKFDEINLSYDDINVKNNQLLKSILFDCLKNFDKRNIHYGYFI